MLGIGIVGGLVAYCHHRLPVWFYGRNSLRWPCRGEIRVVKGCLLEFEGRVGNHPFSRPFAPPRWVSGWKRERTEMEREGEAGFSTHRVDIRSYPSCSLSPSHDAVSWLQAHQNLWLIARVGEIARGHLGSGTGPLPAALRIAPGRGFLGWSFQGEGAFLHNPRLRTCVVKFAGKVLAFAFVRLPVTAGICERLKMTDICCERCKIELRDVELA